MKVNLELTTDTGARITGDEYSFDHDPDAMACYLEGRAALEAAYEALEDDPEPVAAPVPVADPKSAPQPAARVAYGRQVAAREHTEE